MTKEYSQSYKYGKKFRKWIQYENWHKIRDMPLLESVHLKA
jgi:hypothetical protein